MMFRLNHRLLMFLIIAAVCFFLLIPSVWGFPSTKLTDWVLVIKVRGIVESRIGQDHRWDGIWQTRKLRRGDAFRTRAESRAMVRFHDHSTQSVFENTMIVIDKDFIPPGPKFLEQMKQFSGRIKSNVRRKMGTEHTPFRVETPNALLAPRGTAFVAEVQQKIVYVKSPDLWIMNEDGTGRRLFIAAPPGRRIGRAVFAPDGSRVVYEVWTADGMGGMYFSYGFDAAGYYTVDQDEWPLAVGVTWAHEGGLDPTHLRYTVGDRQFDLIPHFQGCGRTWGFRAYNKLEVYILCRGARGEWVFWLPSSGGVVPIRAGRGLFRCACDSVVGIGRGFARAGHLAS